MIPSFSSEDTARNMFKGPAAPEINSRINSKIRATNEQLWLAVVVVWGAANCVER